ncbi:MAG: DUF4097 domain-containing protein, partial [Terriglobia bacterium]
DYFLLRGTPEAAAATRLGGGTIVGLIFLILIGWCFTQIVEHGWWTGPGIVFDDGELSCLFASEYEFTDELVQSVTPPTTLSLSNTRGNVSVTAVPGQPEPPAAEAVLPLRVVVRKKVCAPSQEKASRLAQGFEPVLESTAAGYQFRWEAKGTDSRALRADLTVQVPPGVSLQLSIQRGDVEVSGLEGDLTLDLHRGDATLERIRGNVSVELRRGSVLLAEVTGDARVEGSGEDVTFRDIGGAATLEGGYYAAQFVRIGGPTRFESSRTEFTVPRVDGEVSFASGELLVRGIPGDLRVKTRSKEIELEGVAGRVEVENRNGPVVLRFRTPPTQDIAVETRSGDIELYLPEASAFQITARAREGEIESDFRGPGLSLQSQDREGALLNGTYGATPPTSIRLSTTYGTIYLRYSLPGATSD